MASDESTSLSYRALALQTRATSVAGAGREEARASMKKSLERIRRQVESSLVFLGPNCRLVLLPEYVLTGHPLGEPVDVWADLAGIERDSAEYREFAAIAADNNIFLAGNAYETDSNFPGLYFQACFVFDPTGKLVLRYHRLNSLFTPTPHDVLDKYVELYGEDSIFPVTKTELGNLACLASDEVLFPELARALALNGAEVFLQPTSEAASAQMTNKAVARRARAQENLAYVISSNTAGIKGAAIPEQSTDGGSAIVDYDGRVLVEAGQGESMVANATIDIAALRRARRTPSMTNLPARNRLDLYTKTYSSGEGLEANRLGKGAVPERSYFIDTQREIIKRMIEKGTI